MAVSKHDGTKGAQMSDRFRRVISLIPRLHKSLGTRLMCSDE